MENRDSVQFYDANVFKYLAGLGVIFTKISGLEAPSEANFNHYRTWQTEQPKGAALAPLFLFIWASEKKSKGDKWHTWPMAASKKAE